MFSLSRRRRPMTVVRALSGFCCGASANAASSISCRAPSVGTSFDSSDSSEQSEMNTAPKDLPSALRLHHNAYVVRDQRVTRHFYEDLIGLPLVACWTERVDVIGGTA